jgi:hypothetical protein
MLKIGMVATLLLLATAPVAHAKDVSAQQAGLNYALQQMENPRPNTRLMRRR